MNLDTRRATMIGVVLVAVTLFCCFLTLSGWALGGFRAIFGPDSGNEGSYRVPSVVMAQEYPSTGNIELGRYNLINDLM